jgi:hypothetical protein
MVELKEMTPPAANAPWAGKALSQSERIDMAKRHIWRQRVNADYHVFQIQHKDFILRSRLDKNDLHIFQKSIAKASPLISNGKTYLVNARSRDSTICQVLQAQVSILARLHQKALKHVKPSHLKHWLAGSAKTIQERWAQVCL